MTHTRGSLQVDLARQLGSPAEARWLVEEVLGHAGPRGRDAPLDAAPVGRLQSLCERRLAGEPLQQLLGHWPFRTLDLLVDARVLVPRPETEQVVEVALAELHRLVAARPSGSPVRVADLGTGSGAIALSLAAEAGVGVRSLHVWASDVDAGALEVALANRTRVAQVHPWVAGMVELCPGGWWGALPPELEGTLDLVVSNPPYVSEADWVGLQREVRDHEPKRALVAGPGRGGTPGLAAVEAVVEGAARWLRRPGVAVVELSPEQAEAATGTARQVGAADVRVEPDLAGRSRALVARWDERPVR